MDLALSCNKPLFGCQSRHPDPHPGSGRLAPDDVQLCPINCDVNALPWPPGICDNVFQGGCWSMVHYSGPGTAALSNQGMLCSTWEDENGLPCRASDLLCSQAAAWCRIQKLAVITAVVAPTTVVSNFHGDLPGITHAYLHWSKLDQRNYAQKMHTWYKTLNC